VTFRIIGLEAAQFQHLIGQDQETLGRHRAERHLVTDANSAPCRITLDDVAVGETVILLSHFHQPAATPYQQSGPIFVSETASSVWSKVDEIPPALARRTLSLRGYDKAGSMIVADIVEGANAHQMLNDFLNDHHVAEIHIHFARRGCFAAKALRA
jgi:Protein of unknown function (DUF1203)